MKLKLSNREKFLLTITVICLAIALIYYAVVKPQLEMVSKLEKQAVEYRKIIEVVKSKANLDNEVYKEYKLLSDRTQGLLRNYYPDIIQEKIILMIDEKIKNNNVELVSIAFTEPALTDISMIESETTESTQASELEELVKQFINEKKSADEEQAKDAAKEEALEVEKMTVSLSLTGSYSQIYGFINALEQENRSIVCSNINITSNNNDNVTCDVKLDFYSVPMPFEQEDDYLDWELTGEYGKTSPF